MEEKNASNVISKKQFKKQLSVIKIIIMLNKTALS